MANVIKHKRGSGSDPVANDLVVGEVAIRTDVGKLFTKMDNGSVAEIAGGGSDIAINTLSSSSGTGGGSATFNGSAFRFTLSAPPSVSAQQLLVSINGVIQKPVAGTGQPSEGFSVDGTDIILGDAPETGADFFILTFKSLGVSEPADNSVTSAKIVDGAIVNADINASAAISGTKISPDFGSQAITTTGNLNGKDLVLVDASPSITFNDSNNNPDYKLEVNNGLFRIQDTNASADRLTIDSSGIILVNATSAVGNGTKIEARDDSSSLHGRILANGFIARDNFGSATNLTNGMYSPNSNTLAFATNSTERMRIASNGNVGIGTNNPGSRLEIRNNTATHGVLAVNRVNDDAPALMLGNDSSHNALIATNSSDLRFGVDSAGTFTEKMRLTSSGRVGIGTTSPLSNSVLHVKSSNVADYRPLVVEGSATNGSGIAIHNSGAQRIFIGSGGGNNLSGSSTSDGVIRTETNTVFAVGNQEKMRIDSSGHVGIGTTSTPSVVSIKDTITGVQPIDDTQTITIQTGATSGAVNTGTGIMFLNHNGSSGSGGGTFGGTISCVKENSTVGNTANCMRFATRPNGGGVTERMRIDSGGSVLVATTSTTVNSANFGIVLGNDGSGGMFKNVNGSGDVFRAGGNQGLANIFGDGDITNTNNSYGQASDETLKQDIVDATSQWNDIKNLRVRKFRFKDNPTGVLQIGVVAQEIETVSAGLVKTNEEGIKSVKYSVLYMKAVKCLQEAIAKIEALETKVAALEAK